MPLETSDVLWEPFLAPSVYLSTIEDLSLSISSMVYLAYIQSGRLRIWSCIRKRDTEQLLLQQTRHGSESREVS